MSVLTCGIRKVRTREEFPLLSHCLAHPECNMQCSCCGEGQVPHGLPPNTVGCRCGNLQGCWRLTSCPIAQKAGGRCFA